MNRDGFVASATRSRAGLTSAGPDVHQSAGGGLARAPQHRKVNEEDPAEPFGQAVTEPGHPGLVSISMPIGGAPRRAIAPTLEELAREQFLRR
jgi:hypothetical protein